VPVVVEERAVVTGKHPTALGSFRAASFPAAVGSFPAVAGLEMVEQNRLARLAVSGVMRSLLPAAFDSMREWAEAVGTSRD
jgi:hypothetical protein